MTFSIHGACDAVVSAFAVGLAGGLGLLVALTIGLWILGQVTGKPLLPPLRSRINRPPGLRPDVERPQAPAQQRAP